MPWPVHDSMNQHLEKMNESEYSRPVKVSLVQVEGPQKEGGSRHTRHVHPYWQLDVFFGGNSAIEFDNVTYLPKAGDALIMPPQNWHYYSYGEIGKKGWSFKFDFENIEEKLPPAIIEHTCETDFLVKTLLEAMNTPYDNISSHFSLVEHLIAALLDLHFADTVLQGTEIELVKKVRHIIEDAQGERIKVEVIADKLGYTTTYLTRVFKKQLGVPLKVFIDQQRFNTAKRLLHFSSLNFSEISEELGFKDVFSFSRFFKRMSGESPRNYTAKVISK